MYLPTHQHGLIIGGKRPASSSEELKSKATLWQIEYEGLVAEHCQITFLDENMVYVLRDLSHGSPKGATWISLPNLQASNDWLNLHQNLNYNREFKVS